MLFREVDVEHVGLSARTGPDWKWISHDSIACPFGAGLRNRVAERSPTQNAPSNCISTHRYNVLQTRAGKAREIISIELATRRRLVSWHTHSH